VLDTPQSSPSFSLPFQDKHCRAEKQSAVSVTWSPFPDLNWLSGGISQRSDGGMSWRSGLVAEVVANRRRYFSKLNLDLSDAAAADQVHGTNIVIATIASAGRGMEDSGSRFPATDGLITNQPGLILTTLHADCAPVFYTDPVRRSIGLAHCGWRGILAGLPGLMLKKLTTMYGSRAQDIRAAVGPAISADYYEISPDLANTFATRFGNEVIIQRQGRIHLSLFAAITKDLLESGANPNGLPIPLPCTFSDPNYFSYRRDGADCPSMLAWLVLKPPS
jgi:polyphenol oxidase